MASYFVSAASPDQGCPTLQNAHPLLHAASRAEQRESLAYSVKSLILANTKQTCPSQKRSESNFASAFELMMCRMRGREWWGCVRCM